MEKRFWKQVFISLCENPTKAKKATPNVIISDLEKPNIVRAEEISSES